MPADQASTGTIQLKWELVGRGWAKCHLADDATRASLTASYCTDALADLVAAAGELYGPRRTTRFFFDAEPQELRWVLRQAGDVVAVAIYKFPDIAVSPDLPDSEGTLIWESAHPRGAFAHAVLEAAQTVLTEHGEAGYHAAWVLRPFPLGLLQDLRRLHLRDDVCALPHDLARHWAKPAPAPLPEE